ncbi:MYND-type zinc finger-containing chromatin reader ZMYND8-like [Ovis canadensis]|uniref:MYND-type zinc finger-containing chromatin reader ZMYND8-like n=1 Tax=Ovis canadensis TaxID=37174 RepID=UPI00375096CB
MLVLSRSSSQTPRAGVTATTVTTCTAAITTTSTTGNPVKKQRPLLPKGDCPGHAAGCVELIREVSNALPKVAHGEDAVSAAAAAEPAAASVFPGDEISEQTGCERETCIEILHYWALGLCTISRRTAVQQKGITQNPSTSTITLVTST